MPLVRIGLHSSKILANYKSALNCLHGDLLRSQISGNEDGLPVSEDVRQGRSRVNSD